VLALIPPNTQTITVLAMQLKVDSTVGGLRLSRSEAKDTEEKNFAVAVFAAEEEVAKRLVDIVALNTLFEEIKRRMEDIDHEDADALAPQLAPLAAQIGQHKKRVAELKTRQYVEFKFEETREVEDVVLPVGRFVDVQGWFGQPVMYWYMPESVPVILPLRTTETTTTTKMRMLDKIYALGSDRHSCLRWSGTIRRKTSGRWERRC
jgi:hypothetical protein